MDTEAGSYVREVRKMWGCEECKKLIDLHSKCFVRVKEIGSPIKDQNGHMYRKKEYKRWHLNCALKINDLNTYEKRLLDPVIMAYFKPLAPDGATISEKTDVATENV
jgi:hypothetical protein